MNGTNKVFLLGHIGSDPELRCTATGKHVVKLNVATNHARKVDGVWQETADWHQITLFDADADYVSRYAKKGCVISVEAALRPGKWTDAKGTTHYEVNIVVSKVAYLSKSKTAAVEDALTPDPPLLGDCPPPHEDGDFVSYEGEPGGESGVIADPMEDP